jgi:hypothetical protein
MKPTTLPPFRKNDYSAFSGITVFVMDAIFFADGRGPKAKLQATP